MIMNYDKGGMLTLDKINKLARAVKFTDMPKAMRDNMLKNNDQLAEIKKLVQNAEKELGDKTIDGVKTKGFHVKNDHMVMNIWVDVKTALPVRIEGEMTAAKVKFVMSDIKFVKTIDPKLFSIEPPKGYKIQKQQTISMKPGDIEDLMSLLKIWTQIKDGAFPDAINLFVFAADTQAYMKKLKDAGVSAKNRKNKKLRQKIQNACSKQLISVMTLMSSNKTFHYQGKGVKFGDKDTAVLWYKPEGKDKYIVMFGDLHVKRMLKKDLPKTSTARTPNSRNH
jgi:hypothetical protein